MIVGGAREGAPGSAGQPRSVSCGLKVTPLGIRRIVERFAALGLGVCDVKMPKTDQDDEQDG